MAYSVSNIEEFFSSLISQLLSSSSSLHVFCDEFLRHFFHLLPDQVAVVLREAFLQAGRVISTILSPRVVFSQIVMTGVIQGTLVTSHLVREALDYWKSVFFSKHRKIRELSKAMYDSSSYEEWHRIAIKYDEATGSTQWQQDKTSAFYDHNVLSMRIENIERMMEGGDMFTLMFRLRGCLKRYELGLCHEGLFSKAKSGSKHLVESYNQTIVDALKFIYESAPTQDIPTDAKLAFFNETRHAFGRSALLLSGGAFLGYYHVGLIEQLHFAKLLPRVISGASAGSLMASYVCTATDEELDNSTSQNFPRLDPFQFDWEEDEDCCACCPCCENLARGEPISFCDVHDNEFHSYKKLRPPENNVFADKRSLRNPRNARDPYNQRLDSGKSTDGKSLLGSIRSMRLYCEKRMKRMLKSVLPKSMHQSTDFMVGVFVGGRNPFKLNVNRLISFAKTIAGEYTFQEAFDRTGRILNITVAPVNNYDPPRLLNYLTAPHVCIWSATVASCCIPGAFEAVPLMVKEPNGEYRQEHIWHKNENGTAVGVSEDVRVYSDGSVESDLPMEQVSELFNINHFIISQVNPHSPFMSTIQSRATAWSSKVYSLMAGLFVFLQRCLKSTLRNVIDLGVHRAVRPAWGTRRMFGVFQTITQEYTGRPNDITITPWQDHLSLPTALSSVIKNPTRKELEEIMMASRRATWPKFSRIRAHCMIEMELDRGVQYLRRQVRNENVKEGNIRRHSLGRARRESDASDSSTGAMRKRTSSMTDFYYQFNQ